MPIASMTGYGAATRPWPEEDAELRVEVRTVNARYREVRIRSEFGLQVEHQVAARVAAVVGRGRVQVAIEKVDVSGGPAGARVRLLADRGVHRFLAAAQVARSHGVDLAPPSLADLMDAARLSFQGTASPPGLAEALDEALAKLEAARRAEGRALEAELRRQVQDLRAALDVIEPRLAARRATLAAEIEARIRELAALGLTEPGRERIEQEVAAALVRGDPREELVRLRGHIGRIEALLDEPAAPGQGRRLSFLAQELVREVGTLAAKAAGAGTEDALLSARLAVDRIREQVQNVE